jgi:hypothetical protein
MERCEKGKLAVLAEHSTDGLQHEEQAGKVGN